MDLRSPHLAGLISNAGEVVEHSLLASDLPFCEGDGSTHLTTPGSGVGIGQSVEGLGDSVDVVLAQPQPHLGDCSLFVQEKGLTLPGAHGDDLFQRHPPSEVMRKAMTADRMHRISCSCDALFAALALGTEGGIVLIGHLFFPTFNAKSPNSH